MVACGWVKLSTLWCASILRASPSTIAASIGFVDSSDQSNVVQCSLFAATARPGIRVSIDAFPVRVTYKLQMRVSESGMGHRFNWASVSLLVAMTSCGCAVGPSFNRPAPPNVDRYTREPLAETTASAATRGGKAQRFVRDLDIPGDWWSLL
ncbi:MAG: hypothetical protein WCA14_12645 [Steroidobacteraceae bacterium]